MYNINIMHLLGMLIILLLISGVGAYSGKKVKSASDFSVGGKKSGSLIISGSIIGTLVGGASTIGTAQLAFINGFSAWWFTLGAGIGCAVLGLFFVKPIYQSGKETIPQIISAEFGKTAEIISTLFICTGIFMTIMTQILASVALLTSLFDISQLASSLISITLMAVYVIFGGVWGTGLVGIVKLALIYIFVIAGGFMALKLGGGLGEYTSYFPANQYFNLFSRGFSIDLGAGLSLILGVLSTQTYIQAIISGRDIKTAKKGALASSLLIPPIGIAVIFIGLYMKRFFPDIDPASALPLFVVNTFPDFFAGIVIAILFITIVGTGAGLSLGVGTIFSKDVYKNYINPNADDDKVLFIMRLSIVGILFLAMLATFVNMTAIILNLSFLSMGLRGASIFAPLCGALFMKSAIDPKFATIATLIGPIFVLLGKFIFGDNIDPLFVGVSVSFILVVCGYFNNLNRTIV